MPTDPGAFAQNPFALLSLIAAPAVLTNAASVLALSTSNRFLRASERMRAIATRYHEAHTSEARALLVKQIARVERQAAMLLNGLRAAYVAIGSFVSASLISILGAGVASSSLRAAFTFLAGLALVAGVVGAAGMVWACVNLLGATRLALLNLSEEAAPIPQPELEPGRAEVAFRTRSGTLTVRRENSDANGGDLFVMDFPARPAQPAADRAAAVAAALGARPSEVAHASGVILAVLETADDVRGLAPDMGAIARLGVTMCVTAPADDALPGVDFVSRYFAPAHGIPEDPVTGSSFCTLPPYWAARLGKSAPRARPVSARGGDVRCEDRGERVLIAGQAALVITGTLRY